MLVKNLVFCYSEIRQGGKQSNYKVSNSKSFEKTLKKLLTIKKKSDNLKTW